MNDQLKFSESEVIETDVYWEGEAPAKPYAGPMLWLDGSLALRWEPIVAEEGRWQRKSLKN